MLPVALDDLHSRGLRFRRWCTTAVVNAMRSPLVVCLLSLALTACQSLGLSESDPEHLVSRYSDEHARFIEVQGVRVHAHAVGEGPAVLMLHGALDSLQVWDGWAEHLVSDYHVIRIDIPPFGLSDPMPDGDYHADHFIPVFNGVLDFHGVDRAIVVGNSLGGYFAAYYAVHAPERVEALALISPAAYPQPLPRVLRLAAMPVFGSLFEVATPRPLVRRTMRSMYGDPERLSDDAVQRRFDMIRVSGNRQTARDVIRLMAERRDEEPVWISRITQPTLLIWGEEDTWVPPELAQRWLDDLEDGRLVLYPTVGHLAMEEIPATSAAEFRRFLSVLSER